MSLHFQRVGTLLPDSTNLRSHGPFCCRSLSKEDLRSELASTSSSLASKRRKDDFSAKNFLELPKEIILQILGYVSPFDRHRNVALVLHDLLYF